MFVLFLFVDVKEYHYSQTPTTFPITNQTTPSASVIPSVSITVVSNPSPKNTQSNSTSTKNGDSVQTPVKQPTMGKTPYRSHINGTSAWEHYIHRYRSSHSPSASVLLFVVNYHHPQYEAVNFIVNTYFTKFRERYILDFDVIVLGPVERRNLKVKSNGLPYYGCYSYHTLSVVYHQLCIVEVCNYAGFFFMNDDSYIDPKFLNDYDLSKSWTEPSGVIYYTQKWVWFQRKNKKGVLYSDAFKKAIRRLLDTQEGKECKFDDPHNLRRGFADAFYIVAKDMPRWYKMMTIMKQEYVFLEMAAPTVNWCLTKSVFDNCNHGKMRNKLTCVHMHPMKYRKGKNRIICLDRLDHKNMEVTPPRLY